MSRSEPPSLLDAAHPAPDTWAARTRHPVRLAVGLVAVPVLLTLLVAAVCAWVAPGSTTDVRRLVAVLVLAAGAIATVAATNGWRRTASQGPATWQRPGILAVPAVIALAPIAAGFDLPGTRALAIMVAGYAATGLFEEVWHRGVVLDVLRNSGLRRSALIGGGLFALSHLANIGFGQSLAVSLAQAVGAFCFGVGFSVLRWRTAAVLPLAAIHAVGDLLFHTTALHGGRLWGVLVAHDTLMLLWGLWCLRGAGDDVRTA